MKTNIDLNLIPILEALIAEESVSGAANRLNITQPAVSHALRRLRQHFKDDLFVRAGNKMLPTPLISTIEPFILSTMEGVRRNMVRSASFDPSSASSNFTINSTDVGELVMLPAIVSEIRRSAPKCLTRVVSLPPEHLFSALESGEVDLSLGVKPPDSDSLYQQVIHEQELCCIFSRSRYPDLEAFADVVKFAALPHVAICPYHVDQDAYEWAFRRFGVKRYFACSMKSFLAVPHLVAQSDMVATVPHYFTRIFAGIADLTAVPLPIKTPEMPIWQVWHKRYHTDPANAWLRHKIYKLMRDQN